MSNKSLTTRHPLLLYLKITISISILNNPLYRNGESIMAKTEWGLSLLLMFKMSRNATGELIQYAHFTA